MEAVVDIWNVNKLLGLKIELRTSALVLSRGISISLEQPIWNIEKKIMNHLMDVFSIFISCVFDMRRVTLKWRVNECQVYENFGGSKSIGSSVFWMGVFFAVVPKTNVPHQPALMFCECNTLTKTILRLLTFLCYPKPGIFLLFLIIQYNLFPYNTFQHLGARAHQMLSRQYEHYKKISGVSTAITVVVHPWLLQRYRQNHWAYHPDHK